MKTHILNINMNLICVIHNYWIILFLGDDSDAVLLDAIKYYFKLKYQYKEILKMLHVAYKKKYL